MVDHNPFSKTDKNLKSISTGILGTKDVTCDSAEKVGQKIHKKLDNMMVQDVKIKRNYMITSLVSKASKVQIEKKEVVINPSVLFIRLSALARREENMEKYFKYELTTEPMSLFKDSLMRKPDKSSLRNILLTKEDTKTVCTKTVLDGGSMLHHVFWPPNSTYRELLLHYINTVRENIATVM